MALRYSILRSLGLVKVHHGQVRQFALPAAKKTRPPASEDVQRVISLHYEGDVLADNASLMGDEVPVSNKAYRNPRVAIVANAEQAKIEGNKLNVSDINFTGKYEVLEAGDTIPHEKFDEILAAARQQLSDSSNIYAEDFRLGALAVHGIGARLITNKASLTLVARSLMINKPPRPVDFKSRFNGWNLDPLLQHRDISWNGRYFDIVDQQTVPKKGDRPIIAYLSDKYDSIAVQFVQNSIGVVGANIIAGKNTPIRGLVEAYGLAGSVMINEGSDNALALPSTVFIKNNETTVVINAPDELNGRAFANKSLYGAYYNILTPAGVSALFNGVIESASNVPPANENSFKPKESLTVISNGNSALALTPDNLIPPVKNFIFFETGAKSSSITAKEAAEKLASITNNKKGTVAEQILSGCSSIQVVGTVEQINV